MSDHWFTSDWHLGHQRIIELSNRPFGSVDEMNRQIIDRHNEVVREDDTLWIVGDVCMGPIRESLKLIGELRCRKVYLIAGNHDRCFEGYGDNRVNRPQHQAWIGTYREAGFGLIVTGARIRRNGFGELVGLRLDQTDRARLVGELCHFPTRGESSEERADRFAEYRPRPLGGVDRRPQTRRWVICGHVHDAWLTRGRNFNVGVDKNDFRPWLGDELAHQIDLREREFGATLDPDDDDAVVTHERLT